jgi:hypothetical protein
MEREKNEPINEKVDNLYIVICKHLLCNFQVPNASLCLALELAHIHEKLSGHELQIYPQVKNGNVQTKTARQD